MRQLAERDIECVFVKLCICVCERASQSCRLEWGMRELLSPASLWTEKWGDFLLRSGERHLVQRQLPLIQSPRRLPMRCELWDILSCVCDPKTVPPPLVLGPVYPSCPVPVIFTISFHSDSSLTALSFPMHLNLSSLCPISVFGTQTNIIFASSRIKEHYIEFWVNCVRRDGLF